MKWFSKNKKNEDATIILNEFSVWATIHSINLIDELQKDDKLGWAELINNNIKKSEIIDCFLGAHLFYLNNNVAGDIVNLLFGNDVFEKILSTLPERAKKIAVLSHTLQKTNDNVLITSSLENFYNIKINPFDACVAFVIDQEINNSDEFSNKIGGLLPILNRLQIEQLDWLNELVEKWSKLK